MNNHALSYRTTVTTAPGTIAAASGQLLYIVVQASMRVATLYAVVRAHCTAPPQRAHVRQPARDLPAVRPVREICVIFTGGH